MRALIIVLSLLAVSVPAFGGTIGMTPLFVTAGQSIWQSGSAFQWSYSLHKEGTWDPVEVIAGDPTVPQGLIDIGAWFDAVIRPFVFTQPALELDISISLSAGAFGAMIPAFGIINYPDKVLRGTTFPLSANIAPGLGLISTAGPSFSAAADLTTNFMIFGTAGICFFACEVKPLVEVFNDTSEILAVNRNGDGEVRALGEHVADMRFGPVTNGAGVGVIQSSGEVQPFDPFPIELSNAFAQLAGLPPPNGELVGITYSLVSLKDNISFRILQEFEFTPLLQLLLDVQETGETIQAPLSGNVNYTFPLYGELPGLHVTPRLALSGQLHNRTTVCIDNSLELSALAASFSGYSAGPAFGPYTFLELACVGGEITAYDETFAVEGFNTYTGSTFFVEGVPEPGTAALALTGAAMLIAAGWKRRHRAAHASGLAL